MAGRKSARMVVAKRFVLLFERRYACDEARASDKQSFPQIRVNLSIRTLSRRPSQYLNPKILTATQLGLLTRQR